MTFTEELKNMSEKNAENGRDGDLENEKKDLYELEKEDKSIFEAINL